MITSIWALNVGSTWLQCQMVELTWIQCGSNIVCPIGAFFVIASVSGPSFSYVSYMVGLMNNIFFMDQRGKIIQTETSLFHLSLYLGDIYQNYE